MLERAQGDLKRAFDVRRVRLYVQHEAVAVRSRYRKPIRPREILHRLVILFRRAEARGEFQQREKFMVVRAVRIVKLLKQNIQPGLIPQRQSDGQWQAFGRRHPANRF